MFADHRGARPQVVNTVARGQLHEDSYFYTGVIQGANGYREEQNVMPFPVTMEVLERGQERFNIYCTPCHSRVGNGLGEIVERGYKPAANLHDQVRLSQPLSHYFYVMTHGYGAMPDYSAQLDAGRSLGSGGLYPRTAVEPGSDRSRMCRRACRCRSLRTLQQQQESARSYAQPWALPATAVQAYPPTPRKERRQWLRPIRQTRRFKIPASKPAAAAAK